MADHASPSNSASSSVSLLAPEKQDAADLVTRLAKEMAEQWELGERPITEDFLALNPELWSQPEAAIELIYEETCLRREFGEEINRENLLQRFPQWQTQLEILLDCQLILEPKPEPQYPAIGESLGDFRMVAELGRGGQGVVFLATQPSLSDRPVVLKLTACDDGREHLSLARLQHTHIVPLYAVETFADRNIRALCMPYFGSATLRHILDQLEDVPAQRRTGKHLLDALAKIQESVPVPLPARGPARQMLARASYVQAICWVGSCLAEALHYAHDRGLVHLDLKPSNVLLAVDGQPMLLDFHLTQKPIHPNDPAPDWLGGTPVYMSPEQKAAVNAVQNAEPVPGVVDGKADLYSLGVVLYEALGGSLPLRVGEAPPLCRCNPQVSVGLSDIIQKCLAAAPQDRYAEATQLAGDLQRHLANLKLAGVRNRSGVERWRKWRKRQPYTFPLVAVFIATLMVAVIAGTSRRANLEQHKAQMKQTLDKGQEQLQQGRFQDAQTLFRQAIALGDGMPGSPEMVNDARGLLRRAELGQVHQELHELAAQMRFLYGADGLPVGDLRALEEGCRPFWEKRGLILDRLANQARTGTEPTQIRIDLLDLAILWTDLRVRLATPSGKNQALRDALGVLAQARELFGPSPVLSFERHWYAAELGIPDDNARDVDRGIPRTAWEHYALGRCLLQTNDLAGASEALSRAVALEPHGFWPNFYHGMCAYRREKYWDAVSSFSVCIGASPTSAACYFNRSLAYAALGRLEDSRRDREKALELNPRLGVATRSEQPQ